MAENKRETFGTRLGFILVSAGCAIGIGNVWKFPYIAGANGGAIFVLLYLVFLVLMGVPIMMMEFAIGRRSRKSAVQAYRALEKPGTFWHIHGWLCVTGCYLLMMYYTTVSGWMLSYFYKFATGRFRRVPAGGAAEAFSEMLSNPVEMGIFMAVTVIAGFAVLSFGVKKGLERITTIMMTGLLLLILVLAAHSLTLSGAAEGIRFYLLPSLERAKSVGLLRVVTSAMNQAFFTLSLGTGAMEIFGSYMSDEKTLGEEAIRICALDTFVALISGLIIFPACFSYHVQPDQGPSLIFITLPEVFQNMTAGRFWGAAFFLFMTFASFSTVTAVFENLVANLEDNFGWNRKTCILINLVFLLLASLPCVFGYNIWSGLRFPGGRDVLDFEDFIVSSILLPGGSLVFLLFCVTKWGWGFDSFLKEANKGAGIRMSPKLLFYLKWILPVLILLILIGGLF